MHSWFVDSEAAYGRLFHACESAAGFLLENKNPIRRWGQPAHLTGAKPEPGYRQLKAMRPAIACQGERMGRAAKR